MNKIAGEFREQCKARQKYLREQKKKREQQKLEYYMHGHTSAGIKKTASEQLAEELIKEAGLVNHASKVVHGLKRGTQLITGSRATKLKNNLNDLSNIPTNNLEESMQVGKKMLSTQKALNKEMGKVRATRAGIVGTGAAIGLGANNKSNKQM